MTSDLPAPEATESRRSLDRRLRAGFREAGPAAVAIAVVGGLAVAAFFPPAFAPRWTPRAVLYLGVLPAAVAGLVRLVARRDRAAIAAAGFLGIAVVSALVSDAPARSLLPVYYRHESVVAWASALGAWAIVRSRERSGRELVERAFIVAVAASIVVGVVQLAADVQSGPLAMVGGRASGLSLNPVYLGAVAAGALVWGVGRRLESDGLIHPDVSASLVAIAMLGVWISGSRIALLVVVVTLAALALRNLSVMATRVAPWLMVGLAGGELVRWFNRSRSGGTSRNTGERLGSDEVASGFGVRFEVWGFDVSAFGRRPLLGHGAGSHANAIQPHLTADFVDRTDPDDLLNNWTDAHNVVLELLVSVGAIGLAAAVAFVVLAGRVARGPAAWAAGAIAATWLLQPVSFVTLFPALALLGAASPLATGPTPTMRRPARLSIAAVGLTMSLWLVGADTLLLRADDQRTLASGQLAAGWWWHDPLSAREAAVLGLREAVVGGDDDDAASVLELTRSMTDRDPKLAFWWVQRGDIELIFDLDDRALESYRRALEVQPWSPAAIGSLLELERDPEVIADLECRLDELEAIGTDRPAADSDSCAHAIPDTRR